jgi:Fe-S cluster assembly protein SufD
LDKGTTMNIDALVEDYVPFRQIDKTEPAWLYRMRKDGWEHYHQAPLPERAQHLWHYTDPGPFVIEKPDQLQHLLPEIPDRPPQNIRRLNREHTASGYNRGNLFTSTKTGPELAEKGIILKDLYSAIRENGDLAEKNLGRLIDPGFGKFEALNMALWNNGLFLYIPDNVVIGKPIYLHRHPTGRFTMQRLLIVAGDNSQATIIDDYSSHSGHDSCMTNSAVELYAGDFANIKYVNMQRLADENVTFITIRSKAGHNTNLYSLFGGFGSAVAKVNVGAELTGKGGNSRMAGIIFADGKQHFDYHTRHYHTAGESFSNLDFKVILKDRAASAYTGLIRIEKDAVNCEAYQENRNLLLNKGTRAESIPELEIMTDQVRCTHGATMGPVDREMIFYLKSRGFSQMDAVRAIVEGFVASTLGSAPEEAVRMIQNMVAEKLQEV